MDGSDRADFFPDAGGPAACIRQLQEAAELDGDDALEDPGGTHPVYERRIGAAQSYLHQGSQF